MMTLFLPALSSAQIASAQAESAPTFVTKARRHAPPLRYDMRGIYREGTLGSIVFEGGVQLTRSRLAALDLNLSISPPSPLLIPGPPRSFGFVQLSTDLLWEPSPWLSVGPSLAIDLRGYIQQGVFLDTSFVPSGGLRASIHVLRTPRWSLALTSKLMLDFVTTELRNDSAESFVLSPLSGQIGMRFHFGHGKIHTKRKPTAVDRRKDV